jgi:hypothetical protein
MKPAFTVMAGLVPVICSGSVPGLMARDRPGHDDEADAEATGFLASEAKTIPNTGFSAQLDEDCFASLAMTVARDIRR